jgi:hypothetical protein
MEWLEESLTRAHCDPAAAQLRQSPTAICAALMCDTGASLVNVESLE